MSWEVLETLRREREARVLELIRESFGDNAEPESDLCSVTVNCYGTLDLLELLEDEFNIEIFDADIAALVTVGDVIELVNRRVEYQETEGRR